LGRRHWEVRSQTWLRDTGGSPVWSGAVQDADHAFSLPASAFAPSTRAESHRQLGATWKTTHATGWNASLVATQYRIVEDASRQASLAQPDADLGGAGTVARRDGTGWTTLEFQGSYRPSAGDWGDGRHAPTMGVHRNEYVLRNAVRNAADWRGAEGDLTQRYGGRTRITALYLQDAWRFADDWRLTAGLRQEHFETWDGAQWFTGTLPVQNTYPARRIDATSPKLSLAWAASDLLLLKVSAAKGVRFPNVDELYNGTKTGTNITTSDPALRPEVSEAFELSAELDWGHQSLRASLFRDDVHDTIVRQTDSTVTPSVTRVNNIDRVLTDGLELVWQARGVLLPGLVLGASATWADARIVANAANLATEGKRWLRIPPQRYALQATWRGGNGWLLAAAWRWSGRQYNTDTNVDSNPETYGGVSHVNQLDLKASWQFAPDWTWSIGVDNAAGTPAWQAHTLPQRLWQTALRWEMPR
jgi:iron complex outermembrane receptor protein